MYGMIKQNKTICANTMTKITDTKKIPIFA